MKAGESKEVTFTLKMEDPAKGKAQISVGGGQPVGKTPHLETSL